MNTKMYGTPPNLLPPLPSREVHAWRLLLKPGNREPYAALLSADELARSARFRSRAQRTEFVTVRSTLRKILSGYTGWDAKRLSFHYGERGKPALQHATDLHFNVSHCGTLAVIAVSRVPVGTDVEHIDPDFCWQEIATHFFSPTERDWLRDIPQKCRTEAFFRYWTRREALLKAQGLGLPDELPSATRAADAVLLDGHGGWSICSCVPLPDHVAAVVTRGTENRIRWFSWPAQPVSTTAIA